MGETGLGPSVRTAYRLDGPELVALSSLETFSSLDNDLSSENEGSGELDGDFMRVQRESVQLSEICFGTARH